ncbi:MAG TPA: DUF4340 domain-containing protein [Hyphomicrobiaceae bacterium]|nr:DUF4340 domain-containing protein [Hyphomicrobiaceae bacterium]
MKPKPFAALVAVTALALLFAIVSYASNNRWAPTRISGTALLPGLAAQADRIAKIELSQGGKTLALTREKENWALADRGQYPAKSESVRALIVKLAQAETIEPKTQSKDRLALLELEDPGAKDAKSRLVRLLDDKGAVVGEAIVGKKRFDAFGASKSGTYMRRPGEAQAWLTGADVDVGLGVRDWVRPQVFDLAAAKIAGVSIEIPGEEPLKIAREGDKHALSALPKDQKLKEGANIDAIVRAVGSIDLEDVRKPDGSSGGEAGVAKIEGDGGLGVTLKLRKQGEEYWLALAATGEGDSKATAEEITRRTQGWEFKIPASKAEAILKRRADLTESS